MVPLLAYRPNPKILKWIIIIIQLNTELSGFPNLSLLFKHLLNFQLLHTYNPGVVISPSQRRVG